MSARYVSHRKYRLHWARETGRSSYKFFDWVVGEWGVHIHSLNAGASNEKARARPTRHDPRGFGSNDSNSVTANDNDSLTNWRYCTDMYIYLQYIT